MIKKGLQHINIVLCIFPIVNSIDFCGAFCHLFLLFIICKPLCFICSQMFSVCLHVWVISSTKFCLFFACFTFSTWKLDDLPPASEGPLMNPHKLYKRRDPCVALWCLRPLAVVIPRAQRPARKSACAPDSAASFHSGRTGFRRVSCLLKPCPVRLGIAC